MGPISIFILILLVVGVIVGFFQGFARQIAGLLGTIGGGIAAYFVYGWSYLHVANHIKFIPLWLTALILAVITFI